MLAKNLLNNTLEISYISKEMVTCFYNNKTGIVIGGESKITT
jgi:hypothetical protein